MFNGKLGWKYCWLCDLSIDKSNIRGRPVSGDPRVVLSIINIWDGVEQKVKNKYRYLILKKISSEKW